MARQRTAPAHRMLVGRYPVVEPLWMFMPVVRAPGLQLDAEPPALEERLHILVGHAGVRAASPDRPDHERVSDNEVLVAEPRIVQPEQQGSPLVRWQFH